MKKMPFSKFVRGPAAARVSLLTLSALVLVFFSLMLTWGDSADRGRPLPQDAYVWQRQWTPALRDAMGESSDLIQAWRVLAAESGPTGHLRPVEVDAAKLRESGRPIILVVRIDGQLLQWDTAILLGDLTNLVRSAQQNLGFVTGVEIDHDCGTRRLMEYAAFLSHVRAQFDEKVSLSITALPTWLSSPDLEALLAATDEVVLQVHAVLNPRDGLFDRRLALRWAERLSSRTAKPFRLAVPAYDVRVNWRDDGSILSVEGETPRLLGGNAAAELMASPKDVASFVAEVERRAPLTSPRSPGSGYRPPETRADGVCPPGARCSTGTPSKRTSRQ